MHIDKIRELSLRYASGDPPKQKVAKAIRTKYRKKRRYRIDTYALAVYLAKSSTLELRNKRLAELSLTYTEYIQTSRWKEFREEYILNLKAFRRTRTSDRPDKCEISFCRNRGVILHHRSYDNIGHETFEDVFFVCTACHDKIHSEVKRIKRNVSGKYVSTRFPEQDANYEQHTNEIISEEHLPWGGLFARR